MFIRTHQRLQLLPFWNLKFQTLWEQIFGSEWGGWFTQRMIGDERLDDRWGACSHQHLLSPLHFRIHSTLGWRVSRKLQPSPSLGSQWESDYFFITFAIWCFPSFSLSASISLLRSSGFHFFLSFSSFWYSVSLLTFFMLSFWYFLYLLFLSLFFLYKHDSSQKNFFKNKIHLTLYLFVLVLWESNIKNKI